MKGTLFIVATPIGNLADISARAIQVLNDVDFIYAEDTRHSKRLLDHYQIQTRIRSLHSFNEHKVTAGLIELLQSGQSVALISDAGTPLISDPGYPLIKQARSCQIPVSAIPGPCALIAALCISGIAADQFIFQGFLPAKAKARLERLEGLSEEKQTLIFYEAPHRIQSTVEDMVTAFGEERQVALVREITKRFETVVSGGSSYVLEVLKSDPEQNLGEMVLVVEGNKQERSKEIAPHLLKLFQEMLVDMPAKRASALLAEAFHLDKKILYEISIALKNAN